MTMSENSSISIYIARSALAILYVLLLIIYNAMGTKHPGLCFGLAIAYAVLTWVLFLYRNDWTRAIAKSGLKYFAWFVVLDILAHTALFVLLVSTAGPFRWVSGGVDFAPLFRNVSWDFESIATNVRIFILVAIDFLYYYSIVYFVAFIAAYGNYRNRVDNYTAGAWSPARREGVGQFVLAAPTFG